MQRFTIKIPHSNNHFKIRVRELLQRYENRLTDRVIYTSKTIKAMLQKIMRLRRNKVIVNSNRPGLFITLYNELKPVHYLKAKILPLVIKSIKLREHSVAKLSTIIPSLNNVHWGILEEFDDLLLSALDDTELGDMDFISLNDIEGGADE